MFNHNRVTKHTLQFVLVELEEFRGFLLFPICLLDENAASEVMRGGEVLNDATIPAVLDCIN